MYIQLAWRLWKTWKSYCNKIVKYNVLVCCTSSIIVDYLSACTFSFWVQKRLSWLICWSPNCARRLSDGSSVSLPLNQVRLTFPSSETDKLHSTVWAICSHFWPDWPVLPAKQTSSNIKSYGQSAAMSNWCQKSTTIAWRSGQVFTSLKFVAIWICTQYERSENKRKTPTISETRQRA